LALVEEFVDNGVSGAKRCNKRPAFDRLCKAVIRRKIDASPPGQSIGSADHCTILSLSRRAEWLRVRSHHERQAVDTTTSAGRALFQMLGVFAELDRAIIQERINAGIARAREKGTKGGKPIGRARVDPKIEDTIRALLASGKGILKTAR
jgi:DNA invertase Pin-like site-specific DNA recombinase